MSATDSPGSVPDLRFTEGRVPLDSLLCQLFDQPEYDGNRMISRPVATPEEL